MLIDTPTPRSARTRALIAASTARRPSTPAVLVLGSIALAALSLLLPSATTYDPWAWIIWGREITQLDLSTTYGPSWKPLPVLFTTVFALFGGAAPDLWLVVGRAGAIAGVPLAFLLAARLAGPVAGATAAAGLAVVPWWVRNGALGNSEGLLVALLLGAVLAHLHGRRGWAFALGAGAGLLRPEAWPFLGLYALWLLVDDRRRLPWVAGGMATLPVLWLAPEWWGSGNPFRASDRAQQPNPNSPAFAEHPSLEVVRTAVDMLPTMAAGTLVVLVAAVVVRLVPRGRLGAVLAIAALAVGWLAMVAVMTERGFSGNARYLMAPAALLIVLASLPIGWLAGAAARRSRVLVGPRARAATLVLAGALGVSGFAVHDARHVPEVLRQLDYQAALLDDLDAVVARTGGAEGVLACGRPYTGRYLVPAVAWKLGLHIEQVGYEPRRPAVVFHVRPLPSWGLTPRPDAIEGGQVVARQGDWRLVRACGSPS